MQIRNSTFRLRDVGSMRGRSVRIEVEGSASARVGLCRTVPISSSPYGRWVA